jgi:YfiH family protein
LDKGLCLSVTAADCLPVFLLDTEGGGFGILHSGWKGTGIVSRALALMESCWHARPERVAAILGPCIRSCCYRVNRDRAQAFEAEFGGPGGTYPLGPVARKLAGAGEICRQDTFGETPPSGESAPGNGFSGEFFLDLQAANARLLADAGVRDIAVCQDCTFTDPRLGSFRREGAAYTRMAALIGRF